MKEPRREPASHELIREEQQKEARRREEVRPEEPERQEPQQQETRHEEPRGEAPRREEARREEPRREAPKTDSKALLESSGLVMVETDRSKAAQIAPQPEEPQHLGRPRRERPKPAPQEEALQQVETRK